ncbi:UPF0481 protein At3g47200-like [Lycium barbarum]|uniref:UPF0481 protein At3g47200-like n=1 Tax=Lycium barbarum TaxID=112863 RepID=UPI00293ECEA2|nr:UPF0481 protein At3g47200-like [Lycium barbarum]
MDKQSAKGTTITIEEKTGDNQDECSITIHQESNSNTHEISENEIQWLNSLEKSGGYPAKGSTQKPKIQMVPEILRGIESNISCYEPLVVAIGPFHHGKPKLQPMEKYKEKLAFQFADQESKYVGVSSRLLTNSVTKDELYIRVKNIVPNVRDCYAEDLIKDYNDEEFAQMMFVDGCFILQYILRGFVPGNIKQLHMKITDIALIRRDLFLLENQLPFEVLQVLMTYKFNKDEGMKMINQFISSSHVSPPQEHGFIRSIKDFFGGNPFSPETTNGKGHDHERPSHLLELLRTHLIDPKAFLGGGRYLRGECCSYRSAMELRRAGIHFARGKGRPLSDIKFKSFDCTALLTLPFITIDDSTKSELLNLAAYEACPDTPDDFSVTSYLCFMDSLIDHPEDVKELRSKGILLNFLRTDQEVTNLFKEMAKDLVPNPRAFVDVKYKIEIQCSSKGKAWIAEWKNTHFITPWTFFTFIVAILIIGLQVTDTVLSGIQTYYAVHET